MANIGKRIFHLRKSLNLTQKELAKKAGITEATLSRYENNRRKPKAEVVKKIAEVLGCTTDYLLGQSDNKVSNINSDKKGNFQSKKMEEKITKILIDKGLVAKSEHVPQKVFDNVLKYGLEASIEIFKLEKKLKKY